MRTVCLRVHMPNAQLWLILTRAYIVQSVRIDVTHDDPPSNGVAQV